MGCHHQGTTVAVQGMVSLPGPLLLRSAGAGNKPEGASVPWGKADVLVHLQPSAARTVPINVCQYDLLRPGKHTWIPHVTSQRALKSIFWRAPGSGAVNSIFPTAQEPHEKVSIIGDRQSNNPTQQRLKYKHQGPLFNGEAAPSSPSLWLNYWRAKKQGTHHLMKVLTEAWVYDIFLPPSDSSPS